MLVLSHKMFLPENFNIAGHINGYSTYVWPFSGATLEYFYAILESSIVSNLCVVLQLWSSGAWARSNARKLKTKSATTGRRWGPCQDKRPRQTLPCTSRPRPHPQISTRPRKSLSSPGAMPSPRRHLPIRLSHATSFPFLPPLLSLACSPQTFLNLPA